LVTHVTSVIGIKILKAMFFCKLAIQDQSLPRVMKRNRKHESLQNIQMQTYNTTAFITIQ